MIFFQFYNPFIILYLIYFYCIRNLLSLFIIIVGMNKIILGLGSSRAAPLVWCIHVLSPHCMIIINGGS